MNWLQQLSDWFGSLKAWYTVRPWERAIRVRYGRWTVEIGPGLHLRIPLLDQVFVQNVRLRVLNLPVQTVTNSAGETTTLSGVVSWRIRDVRVMYQRLHTPEDWILNTVLAALAEAVYESREPMSPKAAGEIAAALIMGPARDVGMEIEQVSVTDLAKVRTYRLITGEGNSGWSWSK